MILSPKEIQQIQDLIDRQLSLFVGSTMGKDFLTDSDKYILRKAGIDINKIYSETNDFVRVNYHLGVLSEFLGDARTKQVNLFQLRQYIQSGGYIPLTEKELKVIDSIKFQSLNDIKGIRNRLFTDVNNLISKENFSQRSVYEEIIRDTVKEGFENRKSIRSIASDLSNLTGDYSRDFSKSVSWIGHKALNEGKASIIDQKYGVQAKVVVDVYPGACIHCKRLYEGKVFTLSELLENGSNIGLKPKDWKAVMMPLHPHCRCLLREAPDQDLPKINRPPVQITFNGISYQV